MKKMMIFGLMTVMILAMIGCSNPAAPENLGPYVVINETATRTYDVGQQFTVSTNIEGEVVWTSSRESVIDTDGKAVGEGFTILVATIDGVESNPMSYEIKAAE